MGDIIITESNEIINRLIYTPGGERWVPRNLWSVYGVQDSFTIQDGFTPINYNLPVSNANILISPSTLEGDEWHYKPELIQTMTIKHIIMHNLIKNGLSLHELYNCHIKFLLDGSPINDNILEKINSNLDGENIDTWKRFMVENDNKMTYNNINWLQVHIYKLSQDNLIIKQMGEIKDILDIGIDKPVGYANNAIIPLDVLSNYIGDDYMLLKYNGNYGDHNDDIYVIYVPTLIEFLKLNIKTDITRDELISFMKNIILITVNPEYTLFHLIQTIFSDYNKATAETNGIKCPSNWKQGGGLFNRKRKIKSAIRSRKNKYYKRKTTKKKKKTRKKKKRSTKRKRR